MQYRNMLMLGAAAMAATAIPAGAAVIVAAGTPGTTGATALYLDQASELTASEPITTVERSSFLGRPDDLYTGIGSGFITYDFGDYRLVNGTGSDFSVYEYDLGAVEFSLVDILVSADGLTFFNVAATRVAAVNLAGDEQHGNAGFRASYDLGTAATALGVSHFRYLRLDGIAGGAIAGSNGFDVDAVAGINFALASPPVGGVPEPASWAMMIVGFGAVGVARRRRGVARSLSA